MLLFLENHDSFSHLLADQLWRLGGVCAMVDTYAPYQPDVWAKPYQGVIIGPGPGHERTSPHLMRYVSEAVKTGLPVLGVCLGMQALGVYFGARLCHALAPVHGKIRTCHPRPGSLMYPSGGPEGVVRYHSLVLQNLPDCLQVEAESDQGECMALSHTSLPIWAVQYHPEAACTEGGPALLERWLRFAHVAPIALPLKTGASTPPQVKATFLSLDSLQGGTPVW